MKGFKMYFKRKIDVLLDNWLKKENKSSALVVVYVNVGKLKQFKNLLKEISFN
jgi:hypothetical protein